MTFAVINNAQEVFSFCHCGNIIQPFRALKRSSGIEFRGIWIVKNVLICDFYVQADVHGIGHSSIDNLLKTFNTGIILGA
jgi:hypothetical protein